MSHVYRSQYEIVGIFSKIAAIAGSDVILEGGGLRNPLI